MLLLTMRETRSSVKRRDQRGVTTTSTGTHPRYGCYCERELMAVFGSAKFTEFGFILLPWQLTEAQTLKLRKVISYTDDAKLAA